MSEILDRNDGKEMMREITQHVKDVLKGTIPQDHTMQDIIAESINEWFREGKGRIIIPHIVSEYLTSKIDMNEIVR